MATAEVDLVISGGTLVSPEGSVQASVAVADGVIIAIGAEDRMPSARETIDAGGKHVVPGAIDSHVHFREPGYIHKEDWATGTAAAASGGVTTVFEMPNTNPPTSTADALAIKQEIAAASAHVDYGIYGLLGGGDNLDQLEPMAEAGITGYKCYIGSSTHDHLTPPDDGIILEGFEIIAQTGLRCAVHAENTGINDRRTRLLQEAQRIDPLAHQAARPVVGATEAVGRAIVFAEWTGCRLHIAHESSKDGLHLIRDAKARGVDVTAETCPQYLLLTSEDMKRQGGITRCNPPIREPGHDEGLWQGLRDGIIDMIATDHAPHLPEEKSHANIWHCACGFPGVETQMPLMLTQVNGGRMSINKYVEWASVKPGQGVEPLSEEGRAAGGFRCGHRDRRSGARGDDRPGDAALQEPRFALARCRRQGCPDRDDRPRPGGHAGAASSSASRAGAGPWSRTSRRRRPAMSTRRAPPSCAGRRREGDGGGVMVEAGTVEDGFSRDVCAVLAGFGYDDLPEAVVHSVKLFVMDCLGVVAGAADAPGVGAVHARLGGWEGNGSATTLLGKRRLSPPSAALANATAAHALDFDDQHDPARVHSYCVILPAALAAAEDRGAVDGRRFIAAVAAGVEIHARLGLACYNSIGRGWLPDPHHGCARRGRDRRPHPRAGRGPAPRCGRHRLSPGVGKHSGPRRRGAEQAARARLRRPQRRARRLPRRRRHHPAPTGRWRAGAGCSSSTSGTRSIPSRSPVTSAVYGDSPSSA